jgi:acetyl esterase/lipase
MTACRLAVAALLVLAVAALSAAQEKGQAKAGQAKTPPIPEGTNVLRDIAYVPGGHERQKLDLYLPAAGKDWPLIVWVHGGAWRGGDKGGCPALRFLRDGYAVASVNYRLSQHAPFPAQIEDCKAAIRWLRANATRHGYDAARIGVWGSSAGGHLVALLGTAGDVTAWDAGPHPGASSRVQAVVDFFGPSDLARMGAQSGPDSKLDHDAPTSPESRLIGGPIRENRAKADAASPVTYVSRDDPPFLICHGDKDPTVPIGQSEVLHAALQKAGVDSTYHVVAGAGHGFGNNPEVNRRVAEFFARHLKGK